MIYIPVTNELETVRIKHSAFEKKKRNKSFVAEFLSIINYHTIVKKNSSR